MPSGTSLAEAATLPAQAEAVPRRLRVLHLYRRFHPDYTGDGIYFMRLIPLLRALGSEHAVLAYETRPADGAASALHQGVPVHYLGARPDRRGWLALMRWLLLHLRHYEVLHLHSHVDRHCAAYLLARLLGVRVIFSCTLNDSPTELLEQYRPRNRGVIRLLLHAISAYVVISPQLLRRALETTGPARLRFIPQGVQPGPRRRPGDRLAARQALGLAPGDTLLLNVGSVSRRKNIGFLVEALAGIPDPRVRLLVVGPALEPDYSAELAAAIAAHGLGERVVLAGFQADPRPWYLAADLFVFASTSEGFGNVFLEAMDRSLPIVTCFLPGITDFIIDHGRTGFLAATQGQFVAAVERLRADPALAARIGEAGRDFVERNLDMAQLAARYAALYRDPAQDPAGAAAPPPIPELPVRFSGGLAAGPAAIGLREVDTPRDWRPLLQVVIDTEADFDWDRGIATDTGRVVSISGIEESFPLFERLGLRPTLVIDHPVATHAEGGRIVRKLAAAGCEVGVHLHSWTTPPIVEPKDDWHSFSGNIGAWLERRKLETLTCRVAELTGQAPRIFKAGRYGLGANTVAALEALGFEIDLSICPWYDYSALGGPDFTRFTARPGWFGSGGRMLSLPTTAAPLGWLHGQAGRVAPLLRSRPGKRLGLDRLAARANAFYPMRLSPEGAELAQMRRVARQLHAGGLRVFTLSLHSPTLQVGNTPYVRSAADLRAVLGRIEGFCRFFREELGGEFTTPSALLAKLRALRDGPA
ncbi:glycosyltransferase [Siccirubricoccus phaeus]|uniref:glycosyltransferase n=1 Tax=Siccirubricoccus phaeus TaxID=2595053 RepID=UPI0011F0EABC|nr:glycosyltransferase [Siccirubricoccus phaeus]